MSRTYRKKTDDYDTDRDKKKWFKSPKWFKKMRAKKRKAKEKDALRKGKEIPKFKRDNDWDWN